MKFASLIVIAVLLVGALPAAYAEDAEIENHPGYISFDDIEIPKVSESATEISLGPDLLRLVSKSEDGEVSSRLISLRVKSYESNSIDIESLQPTLDRIERQLEKDDWKQIVKVKEEDERTTVSLKYDEERILGLLVVSIELDGEVTFVNVCGDFDLEDLDDFDLDIDEAAIDSLKESMEEEK